MRIKSHDGRTVGWCLTLLASATLLAWAPLLRAVNLVADDFPYFQKIARHGVLGYFHDFRFWRPLGCTVPVLCYEVHPALPNVLAICAHFGTAVCLFLVLRRLVGGTVMPLLAALIFACVPIGYGAMAWMAAHNYVAGVFTFWLYFLVLCRAGTAADTGTSPQWWTACLAGILAFAVQLGNESLMFATLLAPLVLWSRAAFNFLQSGNWRWRITIAAWSGVVVWFALFRIYGFAPKDPHLNLGTLIAIWWHQYTSVDVFLGWLSPTARKLVFYDISALQVVAALLGLCAFGVALWRLKPFAHGAAESPSPSTLALIGFAVLLLLGYAVIYVIGGGFSLDSRKKYPLVPLALLAACAVLRLPFSTKRLAALAGHWRAACLTILVMGVPTTWLVLGTWNNQTDLYTLVTRRLPLSRPAMGYVIEWHPDLYEEWPQLERTWGYRLDDKWVVDLAVDYRPRNVTRRAVNTSDFTDMRGPCRVVLRSNQSSSAKP